MTAGRQISETNHVRRAGLDDSDAVEPSCTAGRLQAGVSTEPASFTFGDLYAAHAQAVKAYLLRSGFSHADADDLTQETFLRAYRARGTFDPSRGSPGGWIAAIARNLARRFWRRPRGQDLDPQLAEEVLQVIEAGGLEARQQSERVSELVARLPEDLRRLVRWRYVDGLTTRGVAQAAGVPESTVRLRLTQASRQLEAWLRSEGYP